MTTRQPVVSICIPTYNRVSLLKQAIDSVLGQRFEDYELIVSDNASTDDTTSLVNSYSDKRLRYSRNRRNVGVLKNFNHLFTLAKGEYITFFPDDDVMLPDNLAAKVDVLARNPSVGLVHSKYDVIDGCGSVVKYNTNWGHGPDRAADNIEHGYDVLRTMLLKYNIINLPTVVFRRECYERLGPFTNRLVMCFEWEYWMRIAACYDVGFLAKPLVKWRFHPDSITGRELLDEGNAFTPSGLQQVLVAKRLIIKNRLHPFTVDGDLKRQSWERMTCQISDGVEMMLRTQAPNLRAVLFILKICCGVPEMLQRKRIWKLLIKSTLSPRYVAALRRISPI